MKKNVKKLVSIVAVAAMAVSLAACGGGSDDSSSSSSAASTTSESSASSASSESSEASSASSSTSESSAASGDIVIGAAMYDLTNTFYVNMMNAGNEAAEDYGCEVIWQSSEGSLDNEISIVENFISQGVDAIIIDPIDAEGIVPVVEQAGAAGIPVVTAGNKVETEYNVNTLYNDYDDTYAIGKMVAESVGGAGTVGLIYGNSGNYVSDQRQAGFKAAMEEYPDITVVEQPGNFATADAMTAAQDMIGANPDIVAIHSVSDAQTYGVLQAVQAAGLEDQILITSYDGEQEASDYVGSGDFACTLLTGSLRVGYWNVKVAYDLAAGNEVDGDQYMATYFVLNDDLKQIALDNGIIEEDRILTAEEGRTYFEDYSDYKPQ